MSLILPSYQSGFAPRDYEPAYPSLWQGCVGAWAPLLGPTGLVLRDSVGKNDGVLTNGPSYQINGGKYALNFDGVNDHITTTATGPTNSGRGVSLWFKTNNTWLNSGPNQYSHIVKWGTAVSFPADAGKDFSIQFGSDVNIGTNAIAVSQYGNAVGVTGLNDNVWHHGYFVEIAGTYYIYIDGVLRASKAMTTNATTSPVTIGTAYGGYYYRDLLDDIRIYNRALSPNEIRLLASRRGIAYEPRRVRVRYFRGFSPKKKLLEAKITSTVPGSYQTGYAPRDGEPVYPELWKGCVGAWSAGLGATGGVLRDQSGLDNHGTLTNMDPGTDWVISNGSYALDFDGSNDGVVAPPIQFKFPMTFSCWINQRTRNTAFEGILEFTHNSGANPVFQVFDYGNMFFFTDSSNPSNNIFISRTSPDVPPLNKWFHFSLTFYDSVNYGVFIDGRKILSGAIAGFTTGTCSAINIGRRTIAVTGTMNAQIDDIRLYHRPLTESEIRTLATRRNIAYEYKRPRTLFRAYDPIKQVGVGKITSIIPGGYHTGVGGLNNEPAYPELTKGLVGGWCPSLGVTGGVLRDNSGQGNHGTLTNMDVGTDWVLSGGKYALDFDGVNDYVNLSPSPISSLSRGTISAWIYLRSNPGGQGTRVIVSATDTNDSLSIVQFAIWDTPFGSITGTRLAIFVYENGSQVLVSYGNTQLQLNTLYHVAFRQTGSSCQFFLNGIADGANFQNQSGFFASVNTLNFCGIGGEIRSSGLQTSRIWDGRLDDIRIYSRALSDNEIRLLASRRGIGYDYKSHRSYSKTQSSGLLKRLILTGQT